MLNQFFYVVEFHHNGIPQVIRYETEEYAKLHKKQSKFKCQIYRDADFKSLTLKDLFCHEED